MKKAIYGGSFNPVHLDHIALCERIKNEFALDRVILIPTSLTPLKDNSHMVSGEDRFNMCRLACASYDFIEVSDTELRRQGVSYTSDTVRELRNNGEKLYLIVGADMFMTLDKWHESHYLFENTTILAIPRNDIDINILKKKYNEYKSFGCRAFLSASPVGSLSSTLIRNKLKRGEDVARCLHPDVIKYIQEHHLYSD